MTDDDSGVAPPIVDRETWLREREVLLEREKAHTREGDAIAAARRRLPMTEVGPVALDGPDGPTPLAEIFDGRNQLVVYRHMFYVGEGFDRQCEGCTHNLWNIRDAWPYLNARGVSFAVFADGPYEEVAQYRDFMGYTHPWFSNHRVDDPAVGGGGILTCYLRRGDRVFLTYESTARGVEKLAILDLLDRTPYGRQEVWEDSPPGWPQGPTHSYLRTDEHGIAVGIGINGERPGRPTAQWTRPGATTI
ncbi:putative dithiol-disulfide oxidoreductase (DUF899 family) [Brevibacterium sanguinis]|uniref:Dithiol-disulfide oxidoreductase (DUF899 family) n=2 Tax=Brevibacterium TaxID=1696 RepID=A0ABX9GRM8_9MICO|nr:MULTISPECIES: DUF899 family protein [Brevibacterium]RBP63617.1 putative dithiol-disulfide oxidoreductase (DUF899 family) [Brevibacterium sanguinis]RBP70276.1 putative dithiol-disulfide oxidoreductase (DUF899 family) [Brevibacterium celere]